MPKSPFEKKALDNVNLVIEDGEFLALIGHTGSGKSTLIQHLNGLLEPTSGRILVDDIDITNKEAKLTEIRKKIGLVFQYPEYQLFEETIEKDIAFGPNNLGLSSVGWLAIEILYVLAAVIRLAYFNVTEETRQQQTTEKRKYYQGLPVTTSAFI